MLTLGKYTLLQKIGEGRFGEVYQARDNMERLVAIKLLLPIWFKDPTTMERFKREAQAAGSLFHAHIATILSYEETDGRHFLVMRYINGPALDRRLAQGGALPWKEALVVLQQAAEALDYAHQHGFIHRDIKPANILLSAQEGAILTDFGLARAVQTSGLTSSGVLLGTPSYMAPEIWQGKPATAAVDVYALACVFVESLTGVTLFKGESDPHIMTRHVLEGPKFPAKWPKGVPAGIEAVLNKALAKEPGQRYASAGEFGRALAGLETAPRPKASPQPLPVAQSAPPIQKPVPPPPVQNPAPPVTKAPPVRRSAPEHKVSQPPPSIIWPAIGLMGLAILTDLCLEALTRPWNNTALLWLAILWITVPSLASFVGLLMRQRWARLLGMVVVGAIEAISLALLLAMAFTGSFNPVAWWSLLAILLEISFLWGMIADECLEFLEVDLESHVKDWYFLIAASLTGIGLIPVLIWIFYPSDSARIITEGAALLFGVAAVIIGIIELIILIFTGAPAATAVVVAALAFLLNGISGFILSGWEE